MLSSFDQAKVDWWQQFFDAKIVVGESFIDDEWQFEHTFFIVGPFMDAIDTTSM